MTSTNGNGQVKPSKAADRRGAGTRFGEPAGPDPVEAGKKGAAAKEAAIQANITKAREYAAAHLLQAVEVFVSALEADWEKDQDSGPQWYVRLQAAKELVNRIMGQAPQRIEHTEIDAFTKRMDALLEEMDERERASA